MSEAIIKSVRANNPLIHHLTNQVVINFTANGLLAFGGSPIMAKERDEMSDMVRIVNGVLINIGTSLKSELPSMIIAGETANTHGIPVVLDPVGVAATPYRQETIASLVDHINFTAIKGNAGEMAHLVDIPWQTKGVESIDDDVEQLTDIAAHVAKKYNTMAIVTGEVDVICHEGVIKKNTTGHDYLTKITGAGCLLGSIITACLTTEGSSKLDQAYAALNVYGKAAERAAKHANGTGTFIPHFIDELSR